MEEGSGEREVLGLRGNGAGGGGRWKVEAFTLPCWQYALVTELRVIEVT